MIFILIGLSNEFEIMLDDTLQPVVDAGFSRGEWAHFRIVNDMIGGNETHEPARKTRRDVTVVVYPIGKEFFLAARNPIPSVTVFNAKSLVEPSFARENAD
jgi:hypothetical protein